MDYMIEKEREYQNKIIALFQDKLKYGYLGNLQYARNGTKNDKGEENSPLIVSELRLFLSNQKNTDGSNKYTESQISEAIRRLEQEIILPNNKPGTLTDTNTEVYNTLIYPMKIKPDPTKNEQDVYLFDFDNFDNNRFMIAEEVSYIDRLTGVNSRPDLVIYVNGIALAVIELKRSIIDVKEGIKQHLSNQKDLIPSFFTTTQFTAVANETSGFEYATINTPQAYWCPWKKDTNETGIKLSDVEALSMFFNKQDFLTLFRYGVTTDGGVKKVMRPHQFYALKAAMPRLEKKASGVIWHSQGSGKSLTMVWLAAYIRNNFEDPRILVITDRTELDRQIATNFASNGTDLYRAKTQDDLLTTLQGGKEWLICSLIHKFGDRPDAESTQTAGDMIDLDSYLKNLKDKIYKKYGNNFTVKGKNIFVFIDECHRTNSGKLHEAMKEIMGSDVMLIGFTGTPLLKEQKEKQKYEKEFVKISKLSEVKFGPFIHKYLHKQAVEDGVILDLQYENRDVEQRVSDKEKLDEKLADITKGLDEDSRKIIEDRWGTMQRIFSSKERIERIGYSILDDVAKYPLSESWAGAMLVAGNIEAAYKYYDFFQNKSADTSLKDRCAVVTSYDPSVNDLRKKTTDPNIEHSEKFKYDMAKQSFENAGKRNADEYEEWAKDTFIKKPGQLKLLIVVDKLLTGFDAPCATYLYIDKDMRDHNLFQAICRVNRLGTNLKAEDDTKIITHKEYGKIIDFKQLFQKITDAVTNFNDEKGGLSGYDQADIDGLLGDFVEKGKRHLIAAKDAYDSLKATWNNRTMEELKQYYLTDLPNDPAEERRQAMYKITSALVIAYTNLSDYMGKAGFSSEESETYRKAAIEARNVNMLVKQISGDYFDPREKDPEMRALLDRFIKADEATVIVPATADFSFLDLITDSDSEDDIVSKATKQADGNVRGAAEIIEGKARAVINSYQRKDPQLYQSFSARLSKLLEDMKKNATDYAEKMKNLVKLIKDAKNGGVSFPDGITSNLAKALWNNIAVWSGLTTESEQVDAIAKVEHIVENDAPDGYQDPSSFRADILKSELKKELGLEEEQVYNLYNLIVQNA